MVFICVCARETILEVNDMTVFLSGYVCVWGGEIEACPKYLVILGLGFAFC